MGRVNFRGILRAVWVGLFFFLILYVGVRPALRWYYPLHYRETVERFAGRHRLDPLLVTSVMRVESGFDPYAVSVKGARGLMQLMPDTAAWAAGEMGLEDYRIEQLFEPEVNLAIGVWYLATLRQQFDGDTVLALAAYNGGRSNVLRWLSDQSWSGQSETVQDIPFPETRSYVHKVLTTYTWYRNLYDSFGSHLFTHARLGLLVSSQTTL